MILHAFATIGMVLGVLGMVLLILLVIPVQIKDAHEPLPADKWINFLLPIAKISYVISFLPGLLYLTYRTLNMPDQPMSIELFRISIGYGAFVNCLAWLLIYHRKHIASRLTALLGQKG